MSYHTAVNVTHVYVPKPSSTKSTDQNETINSNQLSRVYTFVLLHIDVDNKFNYKQMGKQ